MTPRPLRLTTVMAVARAVLATVDPREAVDVLIAEFGWDATFQACVLLRGDAAAQAFACAWSHLLTEPIEREMGPVDWSAVDF